MKTYKYIFILLLAVMPSITTNAQIGYQVSLLNSATGQPRAGETVTVDIKLTNCENSEVYTTQQKATSNDFGVLSLSVGDAQTFDELDWNKLPLYIEISIDGVLIAKSQVLSVPVAEVAKRILPLDRKSVVGTWYNIYNKEYYYTISNDGSIIHRGFNEARGETRITYGDYFIFGDFLIVNWNSSTDNFFDAGLLRHYIIPIRNDVLIGCGIPGAVQSNEYRK